VELFGKLRALMEGAAFLWLPVHGLSEPILSGDELTTPARLPSPATVIQMPSSVLVPFLMRSSSSLLDDYTMIV